MSGRTIVDLLTGARPVIVAPEASVFELCEAMKAADVGVVLVCDGRELLGIVSEQDVIRKCITEGLSTRETQAQAVMTPDPVTICLYAPADKALTEMVDGGFCHLPVMDGGRPTGVVTLHDVLVANRQAMEREGIAHHQAR